MEKEKHLGGTEAKIGPVMKNRFGKTIAVSQCHDDPERFIEPGYLEQWIPVFENGVYQLPWHQASLLCRRLAVKFNPQSMIREFKEEDIITHVIGVARGGLVPATIISYALEVPLLSYAVSTYNIERDLWTKNDMARKSLKTPGKYNVRQSLNLKELKEKNAHVLVVDDICDSGDTLIYVSGKIAEYEIKAKYATLFTKEKNMKLLDRYGTLIADDTWINFPWEGAL